jgi:hypothetical protein
MEDVRNFMNTQGLQALLLIRIDEAVEKTGSLWVLTKAPAILELEQRGTSHAPSG